MKSIKGINGPIFLLDLAAITGILFFILAPTNLSLPIKTLIGLSALCSSNQSFQECAILTIGSLLLYLLLPNTIVGCLLTVITHQYLKPLLLNAQVETLDYKAIFYHLISYMPTIQWNPHHYLPTFTFKKSTDLKPAITHSNKVTHQKKDNKTTEFTLQS